MIDPQSERAAGLAGYWKTHANRIITVASLALLVGLQASLAIREPIFSPVDEVQHTDYIRAIAEEGHPPLYGQALIDRRLLDLFVHVYPGHATDAQLTPERVGFFNLESYESAQFPLYYVTMAPIYRLLDFNLRLAVIVLRYVNVLLSAALFLVAARLAGMVAPSRRPLATLATLSVMVPPGIALRSSQVTNQVLTAFLVAVLLYLLIRTEKEPRTRSSLLEGAMFGLALMAKLTAVAMGPAAALAWATRQGGIRPRLLPGSASFIVVCLPWLVWSGVVYHFPLPWATRHYERLFDVPFTIPRTFSGIVQLATNLARFYWTPWGWRTVGSLGKVLAVTIVVAGTILLLAAVINGSIRALGPRSEPEWRPMAIAVTALVAGFVGWLALIIALDRVYETDTRELYLFVAPVAVILTGLLVRLPRPIAQFGIVAWLGLLLISNYAFFAAGVCIYRPCV